jgi:hypothetical protein
MGLTPDAIQQAALSILQCRRSKSRQIMGRPRSARTLSFARPTVAPVEGPKPRSQEAASQNLKDRLDSKSQVSRFRVVMSSETRYYEPPKRALACSCFSRCFFLRSRSVSSSQGSAPAYSVNVRISLIQTVEAEGFRGVVWSRRPSGCAGSRRLKGPGDDGAGGWPGWRACCRSGWWRRLRRRSRP